MFLKDCYPELCSTRSSTTLCLQTKCITFASCNLKLILGVEYLLAVVSYVEHLKETITDCLVKMLLQNDLI